MTMNERSTTRGLKYDSKETHNRLVNDTMERFKKQ